MRIKPISGSKFLAKMLKGYGVTTVFWVPSVLRSTLLEIEKLGIKKVVCHSEKAAAYMADGYARATKRPGVAIAQSVGAANMAAGLQDAYLGQSPVIALTGRWPTLLRDKHAYQEIDHWPLFEPVTKFNSYVDSVDELPFYVRQAFREATSGAPGPVHLDLLGIDGSSAVDQEGNLEFYIEEEYKQYPSHRPLTTPEIAREAIELIEHSSKPVIIAGGGATASGASREIVRLSEALSIPVATSLNGKGLINESHDLSAGVTGSYSRESANKIVSESDLVIFLGSQTGGQVTNFWGVPNKTAKFIQVNITANELGRNYPADVSILGDVRETLRMFLEVIKASDYETKDRTQWLSRVSEIKDQWLEKSRALLNSDDTPIRPERLCNEISDFLPEDSILVSDTGHSGIWTGTMVELRKPGQKYLRCAGSLGWAFPAALGAKCAEPDKAVVCFTGDGGFWYHLSEMETAVRAGINTITVVNNNRALNQDRGSVKNLYKDFPEGKSDEHWVFEDVNFAEIASTIGCLGIRVEHPGDIRSALDQALVSDKPVIIDVVTDITAAAPPPYSP